MQQSTIIPVIFLDSLVVAVFVPAEVPDTANLLLLACTNTLGIHSVKIITERKIRVIKYMVLIAI
jgi:hypothetical protein